MRTRMEGQELGQEFLPGMEPSGLESLHEGDAMVDVSPRP